MIEILHPDQLHGNAKDISGEVNGYLTALLPINDEGHGVSYLCVCVCGDLVTPRRYNFVRTKSCGCKTGELISQARRRVSPHLVYNSRREYQKWSHMIRRCTNPNHKQYEDYGGRGITAQESWLRRDTEGSDGKFSGFTQFMCDMGLCPEGYSLDRKDSDGDYTSDNCWWAPPWFQKANKRATKKLLKTALEKGWTLKKLANAIGVRA